MDSLSFNFVLLDEVLRQLSSTDMLDIIYRTSAKTVGHLTVSPSLEVKAPPWAISIKRPVQNSRTYTKSKTAKPQSFNQPSVAKPGNASVQIQPAFQQDPNDLVGTMQSLDSGEKVYSCKLCGLQGKQRTNVKMHVVRIHMKSLQETFACSMCEGKSFTDKRNLRKHYMRSHNMNEKVANAAIEA